MSLCRSLPAFRSLSFPPRFVAMSLAIVDSVIAQVSALSVTAAGKQSIIPTETKDKKVTPLAHRTQHARATQLGRMQAELVLLL